MAELRWDPEAKPKKPAIVGIGAQKAGTSWLSQMLSQHPQVWGTPYKEAQFFNHMFIPEHRYWIAWHYRQKPKEIRTRYKRRGEQLPPELDRYLRRVSNAKGIFTPNWYRWMFQPAPRGSRPMDVTPEYSQLPDEGVAYVAEWLPRARFIYLIRDPAERAASQLRMNLMREKRRPETLADWLREVEAPVLDERGDYATYLPRWQSHAGERLLVLPYGRIRREPRALLAEVEAFCGLKPFDYRNPQVVVFKGPDDITLPLEAMAALRHRLAPQYDFLRASFGEEFLALTR